MLLFKRNALLKTVLGILIVTCCTINSFAFWVFNTTENGFTGTKSLSSTEASIGDLIVQGGAAFLDSYSSTLQYMKKTESASLLGVNQSELLTLLKKALSSMTLATGYYSKLKAVAAVTPYNSSVIDVLKTFDYDAFLKSNEGYINPAVFDEVKGYLIVGDIRGIYTKIYTDSVQIESLINRLIDLTNAGVIPSMPETYKVNHLFSQTLLFGQYTAQVFNTITKSIR